MVKSEPSKTFQDGFGYAVKILSVISILFILMYIALAIIRMNYPYELEWIEGGMVDQVNRIIDGKPLYDSPSIYNVPFLYPPVYFYVSAFFAFIFGRGFFPLRFVSFFSSLVSFLMIFLIVKRETKNNWIAIISTGLFAASFRVTGAWFDIARVDSLFVAIFLVFVYFARGQDSNQKAVLVGILGALVFLVKQTGLVICFPIFLFLLIKNKRRGLISLATFLMIIGISTILFNKFTDGWYSVYVFNLLHQQTEWIPSLFLTFWGVDLIFKLPVALLFSLLFLKNKTQSRFKNWFWLCLLAGVLAGSFITRVKVGGYDNVLMPLYAGLSITFGLGLNEVLETPGILLNKSSRWENALIFSFCLLQFGLLTYNPVDQLPSAADKKAGDDLIKYLSNIEGEVFIPDHGYLNELAGKQTYAHHSAIWDVMRSNEENNLKNALFEELNHHLQDQTFNVIIMDSEWNYCCQNIDQYYTRTGEVFSLEDVFYPVTGWQRRPTFIYQPIDRQ